VEPNFLCRDPFFIYIVVANAGESFAEQLDASHQHDCPWRGNSCADSLVQFHLTSSALGGGFKDRCDGLMQFASLPVIDPSAIDSMKLTRGDEIDHILSQPIAILSGELGYKTGCTTGIDINRQDDTCGYSQVSLIIDAFSLLLFSLLVIIRTCNLI
jgi:hypothetical protein